MIYLSDIERDAVAEAFNLGMGAAGNALSEMLGREVELSVPYVNIEKRIDAVANMLQNGHTDLSGVKEEFSRNQISGVREEFNGPFEGAALLLFPEERSLELVRMLLQQPDIDAEMLSEMEQEALVEVGNIILNACLSAIAEIVGGEIVNEIPEAVKGTIDDIIRQAGQDKPEEFVMKLHMHFDVAEVKIEGDIAFIMDINSLDSFRVRLSEYFGFDAA